MTHIQWLKQEIRSHDDTEVRIDFLAALLVFVNDEQARRFINLCHWLYCRAYTQEQVSAMRVAGNGKRKRKSKVQENESGGCLDSEGGE